MDFSRRGEAHNYQATMVYRMAMGAVFHPLNYTKALMQMGHEPLPLTVGRRRVIFGDRKYMLPNAFAYMNYIYRRDGFTGLFRGLGASCGSNLCGMLVYDKVYGFLDYYFPEPAPEQWESDNQVFDRRFIQLCKKTISKVAGVIAARPLRVVMLRTMAEFVGEEKVYSFGVLAGLETVYNESGVKGWFRGLFPELVAEICFLWITAELTYILEKLYHRFLAPKLSLGDDSDHCDIGEPFTFRDIYFHAVGYFVPHYTSSFFYPFHLTASLMAVNNCGLRAGQPPMCPAFTDWGECYRYLTNTNQLKRGSGMFLRVYEGPIAFRGSAIYASPDRFKPKE